MDDTYMYFHLPSYSCVDFQPHVCSQLSTTLYLLPLFINYCVQKFVSLQFLSSETHKHRIFKSKSVNIQFYKLKNICDCLLYQALSLVGQVQHEVNRMEQRKF